MGKVVLDVSVSLDGFAAGPRVRPEEPMGDGGERLHEWMATDVAVRAATDARVGAAVIGRRTFDLGLKPWGGTPWPGVPSFVVTHRVRADLVGDNGGTFAFDGLESAVRRARAAAGDKDVLVLGPDVARQLLAAGLLDELHLHLAPILLGGGTPLFADSHAELIQTDSATGSATHVRYRVA
ncbi:dihydrofolate reductase family protein [Asanoa sp. NPDC050611]|uniref:dihydrofolate reductase family protein n=1 Tax=Asanoa sp. NPDC050611 TaxID=3157098 RepID=UPI0033DCBF5D